MELWIERLLGSQTNDEEFVELLLGASSHHRQYGAGQTLLFENDRLEVLYALNAGWVGISRDLEDGSEQTIDFFLPGQLVGLRQLASPESMVCFKSLTDIEVTLVSRQKLQEAMNTLPKLNNIILSKLALEESWMNERLTTLGQRSAAQCVLHLLLEVKYRLDCIETEKNSAVDIELPISQEQMGSILALTPVHISRVLRELRSKNLLENAGAGWNFPDQSAAESYCEFNAKRLGLD